MDIFSGKAVCLVFASKKHFYAARLEENIDTFIRLNEYGFEVIFLYGDGNIKDYNLQQRVNSTIYELTVPVEDSYLYLAPRADYAYGLLSRAGCLGVLKVDDNTRILNWSCIREFIKEYMLVSDYFGICMSSYEEGLHPVNSKDNRIYTLKLFFKTSKPIVFFIGSFYWISAKVLNYIEKNHLEQPLEDVAVALCVDCIENPVINMCSWYVDRFITWDYTRQLT